jgi:HPt (histidine-containing phosphotransfer) domain-containing protein
MEPLIDAAALRERCFGDPELVAELAAMFAAQAPALLDALDAAEGAARAEIAHRLKGSALALAAGPLAQAAARVEAAPDDPARPAEARRLALLTIEALARVVQA